MSIKSIKEFVVRNKGKFIVGVWVFIGGVVLYSTIGNERKEHEAEGKQIVDSLINSLNNRPKFLNTDNVYCGSKGYDSLDDAIEQFKEYQKTNKVVELYWEDDTYAVLDLQLKDEFPKESIDNDKEVAEVAEALRDLGY